MKHGKLGIKELHTGRNVSVLLYSGLITNARVVRKAAPVREWLATESILGKPETRKDIFKTELNAALSVDDIDLLVPESDLRDRIQVFTTKEKAIKWAKRFGRETKIVSGSEMLETLKLNPFFGQGNRRIADQFGTKGIVNECGSRQQMMGLNSMQTLKKVVEEAKLAHKEDDGKLAFKRYPTNTLRKYINTVVSEVMRLNALSYIEFEYNEMDDEVIVSNAESKLGDLPVPMDSVVEMLHVACSNHLNDIRVVIEIKDETKRISVKE